MRLPLLLLLAGQDVMGQGPDGALPAEETRLHIDRRALVCFRAPDHPEHATARGPLVEGWATFTYLGPDATGAGVEELGEHPDLAGGAVIHLGAVEDGELGAGP